MKWRLLLLLAVILFVALSALRGPRNSEETVADEDDFLDEAMKQARENRGRGLRELDLSKPLPATIKDGPYDVDVDVGLAFRVDYPELLEVLLREEDIQARDERGDSLLHQAANHRASNCAQLLLDRGLEVNATNDRGWTPLMEAVDERSPETVNVLLAAGADPNPSAPDGTSALSIAARRDLVELAETLLEHGARVEGPAGDFEPFHTALGYGSIKAMAVLKKAGGVPPQSRDELSEQLRKAVNRGNSEGAAILMELGADPHAKGDQGLSAIEIAEYMETDRAGSSRGVLEILNR